MLEPAATVDDFKRSRVLGAAMKIFLAYGFSRTTMDDIAKAADMSRPALYLVFRNKTEIYRAIADLMLTESVGKARAALEGDGSLGERLTAAIDEALIAMMARFAESPHGAEILDMKNGLAGDIVGRWRGRIEALIAGAIGAEAARTGVDLSARGLSEALLAAMLLDALEGMKSRVAGADAQRQAAAGIVRVVERAVAA
jgi:AcrR family transcriptional regulator